MSVCLNLSLSPLVGRLCLSLGLSVCLSASLFKTTVEAAPIFVSFLFSFFLFSSRLLTVYIPSRQLRSSADTRILRTRYVKTEAFRQRSYSYCASKQWNSHPSDIRLIHSSHGLKTALKTHPLQTVPQQMILNLLSWYCSSTETVRFIRAGRRAGAGINGGSRQIYLVPQVPFLSRQNTFVATSLLLSRQNTSFVATNRRLSRQK